MIKVSIIIPAWSHWETTKKCLESIAQSCEKDALLDVIQVIVVANDTLHPLGAKILPTLQALFSEHAKHIQLPSNYTIATAYNAGAKVAKGSFFFFLNSNTTITEGCLPSLLHALEKNPNLGMVGPLSLTLNNKVHHAGICFKPNLELAHAHFLMPATYVIPLKQRFWQAIHGDAMLIPAQLFRQCGDFLEESIHGFEDLELCYRVHESGRKLTVVHESIVYHHADQTLSTFTHAAENQKAFEQKYHDSFIPDMHKLAAEIGLEAQLSPDFKMYMGLSPSKEKAYNLIFTENFDENRCIARLNTDPYWLGGYEILATFYEKKQRWSDAVDIRSRQIQLAPLVKNFASLAYGAANTGDTEIVNTSKQSLHRIACKINNIESLRNKAFYIQEMASQQKDIALVKLVEQWIEESSL